MGSKTPEKLPKTGDYALCSSCGYGLHLDTCSIKKKTWNNMSVISLGVQRAILAKVNSIFDMRAKVDSIEESMKFIADKYYSLLAELMGLRKENGELRAKVEVLENK
ncbi:hypothetical protein J6590_064463 [Homalodisca vitripennis]|nr:hypothetical protein J6590_064463 [Homalodisca vitripennis]